MGLLRQALRMMKFRAVPASTMLASTCSADRQSAFAVIALSTLAPIGIR